MPDLKSILDPLTTESVLSEKLEDGAVRCLACAHRCRIQPGKRGICLVRYNQDGVLRVPRGYVAGAQIDPIEKKPFDHFLPGSDALTFGMLGCNMKCDFCQNWLTSQALREPAAEEASQFIQKISAPQLVDYAVHNGAAVIASSYNEPLITSEWAFEVFSLAKQKGIHTVYVSNGFATPEVLNYLRPVLDGFKVDLKTMQEKQYHDCGGKLKDVQDSIALARQLGLWVEVVTLVIPDFNDSNEELWEAARFLTSVSADIPWHVTAFHPDYKHEDAEPTSAEILQRAADIGQEAGLHYVYAGNLPGRVGSLENTFCPRCNTAVIRRRGYTILEYRITADGKCPKCGTALAGVWTDHPESVRVGGWGMPRKI
jgi:pyruvate formate lyase activating enzyme